MPGDSQHITVPAVVRDAIELMRRNRRATSTVIYSGVTLAALAFSYFIRFELTFGPEFSEQFWPAAAILVVIRLGANYSFRMGISRWRNVGTRDVIRLLWAVSVGSLIFFAIAWGLEFGPRVPRSVILLEGVFKVYFTAGVWVVYRLVYERLRAGSAGSHTPVLVVGAGEAGQILVQRFLNDMAMHRFLWYLLVTVAGFPGPGGEPCRSRAGEPSWC